MEPLFKPVAWSFNASVYEVNLRQYTQEGTFTAFAKEMPRLRDMGIEVLWFMPITPVSIEKRLGTMGSYYACSDYMATNPEFGSIDDFKQLVAEAHQLGFKVIIDWVANHTGWDHCWTVTHPEFYKKDSSGNFYDSNGWIDVIDLNYYDHAMRRAMIIAMEFWVNTCQIDGFRCDMAHLIPLDFWKQARTHLDAIKPLFWMAETEDIHYTQAFDFSYAWHWMHQSEKFARVNRTIDEFRQDLQQYLDKITPYSTYLFFTSNHDENSWNGTEYEKYGEMALCFAVMTCTWSGLPLIYSGQEMPNRKRLKFFEKDAIEWTGRNELHQFYKKLLELRRSNAALSGDSSVAQTKFIHTTNDRQVIAYLRSSQDRQVMVLLNFSDAPQHLLVDTQYLTGSYRNIFSEVITDMPSSNHFEIEPWSFLVLENIHGDSQNRLFKFGSE
ncbi:MAG: alpha-amylase family glycosyl hydrolase [Flavitalea sp.]